jgi:hypothetical protein
MSVSCTKKNEDNEKNDNEIYTTRVKRNDIAAYGNFVFLEYGKIYRFNRKTESLENACSDIECEGMCPLDCVMSRFVGASDGKLYFCGWQQYTHYTYLACHDIKSGDIKVVKMLEDSEDPLDYNTFIEDGYWYYKRMILKEGGEATNPEDYEPYLCRISLDGKKDEVFVKCEGGEMIGMIDSGKIITVIRNVIYSTDINTKEKKEIYDLTANGYTVASEMSGVDGKIYLMVSLSQEYVDEAIGYTCMLFALLNIDANTGEVKRFVEEPIVGFCVTDDAVYYTPFKLRIPEGYEEDREGKTVRMNDETLYACDHDGKNIRKVYTDGSVYYSDWCTVIDGYIYGWMNEVDPNTYKLGPLFIGGIEIATGKLIKTEKPE